ncbi:MAG: penicillin-binding protein 2 [Candidatus Shapirobacteria bacterium]
MNPNRISSLALSLTLSFLFLIFRVLQIQFQDNKSNVLNTNQARVLSTLSSERGIIYSSDQYPLALNQITLQISLYKPELKLNQSQLLDQLNRLNQLTATDLTTINNFYLRPATQWADLNTRFLTENQTQLAKIKGIKINQTSVRIYPTTFAYPHLVGTWSKNQFGNYTGTSGLENYYQRLLTGQIGYFYSLKDALNNPIISKNTLYLPPTNGLPIHSGINRFAQLILEKELISGLTEYQAKSASAIILDSSNCEIMAMASFEASQSGVVAPNPNPALTRLIEPGSVFKPLVMASALDNRAISTDYVCPTCDRPFRASGFEINNWDNSFHPQTNLQDILKNSDNIGMSHLINKLGLKNFLKYYHELGLDQITRIDLPGETTSSLKTYWSDIDLATASFGQGIAITPLQMITAFNSLANHGQTCTPHLNRQVTNDYRKIFTPATTKIISDYLKYATENSAANNFRPPNLEACAKSGTAQVAAGGNYNSNQVIASYIGYSPCFKPKFTLYVILENPQSSNWGSSTAAPIWYKISSQIETLL